MTFRAYCPVPKCQPTKAFIAQDRKAAIELVRQHLKDNLADPLHSEIAETEGWLDPEPDPLGD